MEEHKELLVKIVKALKERAKLEKVFIEFQYRYRGETFYIDILAQKSNHLFLFECKKKGKRDKAEKQLHFHKQALENTKRDQYWEGKLFPYTKISLFYISEMENKIVNLEAKKELLLDPLFLDDPIPFLEDEDL
ncbi:MAG: hypothetical protein Q8R18_03995 [bacterium]|nr:hypothetical protein [bacterium]